MEAEEYSNFEILIKKLRPTPGNFRYSLVLKLLQNLGPKLMFFSI